MYPLVQTTKKPYIVGVTGSTLGTFKTGTLALLDYAMYRQGFTVYANHELKFPHKNFWDLYNDTEQLVHAKNAVFSIDDANNLPGWESRRSGDPLNILVSNVAQGNRKMNRYLFFSAPRLIWVEIRLWDLAVVHIYTDHMRVGDEDMVKWEVLDKRYPVRDPRRYYERWLHADKIYSLYDTGELITPTMLSERPEMSYKVPMSGPPIKDAVSSCPRCESAGRGGGDLRFSRRDGLQYCRKCGWEREIKRKEKRAK
jgi:hypothetical protein